MKIVMTSMLSGKVRTREISISQEQVDAWKNGAMIQDVMPDISPTDREFLITGVTSEEWDELFPEDDYSINDYNGE